MPNWSYNQHLVKGNKNEIARFINLGLRNSALPEINRTPTQKELREGFDRLVSKGKHQSAFYKNEEDNIKAKNDFHFRYENPITMENGVVGLADGLTMRTFVPFEDESYLLCDTTNHPNSAPKEVLERQIALGAVGWYDYNVRTLGTKWDTDLESPELTIISDDDVHITFNTQTAWSFPVAWMVKLKNLFPELGFHYAAEEESGAYRCWGYAGTDTCHDEGSVDDSDIEPQGEDEDDEDYYDRLSETLSERFDSGVEGYFESL